MSLAPLVSVIMPCYNRAGLIKDSILSVKEQVFRNWELIIVDDYSSDEVLELIENFIVTDTRIKLIKKKAEKKGAAASRNIGLNLSRGKYVVFLDSDDLLSPTCLGNRLEKMDNLNIDFLVFQTLTFSEKPYDSNILLNTDTTDEIIFRFLNLDVPWLSSGPIWKKESILKIGGWNENLLSWQDWELHVRALTNGLNYKYEHQIDNFWRLPSAQGSIGLNSQRLGHQLAQLAILNDLLSNQGIVLRNRDKLLGLKIWLIENCLKQRKSVRMLIDYFTTLLKIHTLKGVATFFIFILSSKSIINMERPDFGTLRKIKVKL